MWESVCASGLCACVWMPHLAKPIIASAGARATAHNDGHTSGNAARATIERHTQSGGEQPAVLSRRPRFSVLDSSWSAYSSTTLCRCSSPMRQRMGVNTIIACKPMASCRAAEVPCVVRSCTIHAHISALKSTVMMLRVRDGVRGNGTWELANTLAAAGAAGGAVGSSRKRLLLWWHFG